MTTLKERYALERVIGRGASGSVWVADDLQLGRRVAVKRLDREIAEDSEVSGDFEREAWTIAQLRSPHIVQVFDSGVDSGVPFIVMELLHGESLEDRLARYQAPSRLPPRIAASIVADIARGLAVSHRAGIVHRDLKPGNVFIARENGRELAKLLDFGIARVTRGKDNPALEPGVLVGTPQFMSPEHFEGVDLDSRADVWSLAVLGYRMLTGQLPFRGDTLQQLRSRVCSAAFVRPTEAIPSLHAGIDRVFERAFAVKPSERYQSAAELALSFDQVAGDSRPNPSVRVLFVDDLEDMETLVRQWFRRDVKSGNYELFFARSGQEGLDELARRPDLDVVITDINMPEMDGLTFLAKVKDVNPFVRVVVLSAYNDMTNIRTAMNRGAFDFLCKPIDFEDLRRTIEKCAGHVRTVRQLLESHQENEILRALIGGAEAERLVAEVRSANGMHALSFEGTVAVIGLENGSQLASTEPPDALFSRLNAHFDLVVPEIHGRLGSVHRFAGEAIIAVFDGAEHLTRAVDACLAVVERVRVANIDAGRQEPYGVTVGIDSDWLVTGGVGSPSMGRFERSLLGNALTNALQLQKVARPMEVLATARLEPALKSFYRCRPDPARRPAPIDMPVCRVDGRTRTGVVESNATATLDGRDAAAQRSTPRE